MLALVALLLVSCSKEAAAPAGNEQAVIDKANADVMAAEAAGKWARPAAEPPSPLWVKEEQKERGEATPSDESKRAVPRDRPFRSLAGFR